MSPSSNSKLVQRTIDLNYINKKRSNSVKWIIVNAVFLLIFAYDLSCKCPGHTSILHYVELICAGVLAANLIQYALSMIPSKAAKLPLSRDQQKLLGLSCADLDSSFILTQSECSRIQASESDGDKWPTSDAELSLSPRTWRASASPPSPPSPVSSSRRAPSPAHSQSPSSFDAVSDHFFADRGSLADYLRHYEERSRAESAGEGTGPARAAPPPVYQLASPDAGHGKLEESSPQGSPQVWWRLDLDPQRLTQWNLNLRLWIHVTILERLVHEIRSTDEELARLALCEAGALRAGRAAPARLRALALHVPALAPLLPFLEPFPDQCYVVRRITELAQGGCLSSYRWDRGGSDWDASKPTDAELVLHLFATYLDGQLAGGGGARPFSAEHVREASAARRGGGAPAVVRVSARPPHYALALAEETLDVGRGRNNLLHTLLLFLAAAARSDPPALARTHLGRAGLNMLWIIGR
ncbi:transmembrane protein 209 isoform X1 [Nymphalis io]|uniref:transmembrane protein 209 isoform X1 n=2 Tax=Inachis io TaxID=171585 RepID=UPI0021692D61|nr:transmembrane protein 209 isoform X1 [Nymphalis io]